MDNMQADALRRAREMQGNTQIPQRKEKSAHTEQAGAFVPPSPRRERSAQTEQVGVNSQSHFNSTTPSATCSDSFLKDGALFADKEKMLILALILILCTEEKSDPALTLALLYLII